MKPLLALALLPPAFVAGCGGTGNAAFAPTSRTDLEPSRGYNGVLAPLVTYRSTALGFVRATARTADRGPEAVVEAVRNGRSVALVLPNPGEGLAYDLAAPQASALRATLAYAEGAPLTFKAWRATAGTVRILRARPPTATDEGLFRVRYDRVLLSPDPVPSANAAAGALVLTGEIDAPYPSPEP